MSEWILNDCTICHNAPGIWRSRSDPAYYACDDCFLAEDPMADRDATFAKYGNNSLRHVTEQPRIIDHSVEEDNG